MHIRRWPMVPDSTNEQRGIWFCSKPESEMKCLNKTLYTLRRFMRESKSTSVLLLPPRKLISGNSYQILANGQFESSSASPLLFLFFSIYLLFEHECVSECECIINVQHYGCVCIKNRILSRNSQSTHANEQMYICNKMNQIKKQQQKDTAKERREKYYLQIAKRAVYMLKW